MKPLQTLLTAGPVLAALVCASPALAGDKSAPKSDAAAEELDAEAGASGEAADPTGGYLNIYNDVMDEEARAGMGRASDQLT